MPSSNSSNLLPMSSRPSNGLMMRPCLKKRSQSDLLTIPHSSSSSISSSSLSSSWMSITESAITTTTAVTVSPIQASTWKKGLLHEVDVVVDEKDYHQSKKKSKVYDYGNKLNPKDVPERETSSLPQQQERRTGTIKTNTTVASPTTAAAEWKVGPGSSTIDSLPTVPMFHLSPPMTHLVLDGNEMALNCIGLEDICSKIVECVFTMNAVGRYYRNKVRLRYCVFNLNYLHYLPPIKTILTSHSHSSFVIIHISPPTSHSSLSLSLSLTDQK